MRTFLLGALIATGSVGTVAAQSAPPEGPPPAGWPGGPGGPGGPRARLFISPMGEPFRQVPGGPAPQDVWFDGADTNHDGVLTEDEMVADAARFFALLDERHDGEIDPDDIERYETVLVPEIRTGGMGMGMGGRGAGGGRGRRGGGGPPGGGGPDGGGPGGGDSGSAPRSVQMKQGAARFGYLDYPEPITVADRNLNRGVDTVEFRKAAEIRFAALDTNHDGKIEKGELPRLSGGFGGRGPRRGDGPADGRQDIPDAP
ncbi:EF-hand domain-containing protein [Sphingomonas sp. CJ20]